MVTTTPLLSPFTFVDGNNYSSPLSFHLSTHAPVTHHTGKILAAHTPMLLGEQEFKFGASSRVYK
jgi:hypothetical protein